MIEDPRNITACTHLLFMAKNIERIGDHATNIAETLYFMVHGTPLALARPKRDRTTSASAPLAGEIGANGKNGHGPEDSAQ
jgi:phosphate transport system protein